MNKIALIFPVLQSYEVVERQIKYMNSLDLPDSWEIVIVDDGSDPPLDIRTSPLFDLTLVQTHDYRKWTQAKAVNFGVEKAMPSIYIWTLAIDHFISKKNIEDIQNFTGDKMVFPRKFAIIDENGAMDDSELSLIKYGWVEKQQLQGKKIGAGPGIFVIKRSIWDELGGYNMDRFGEGGYGGDDVDINHRYAALYREGKVTRHKVGSSMYVFPSPAYDAMEIFHDLRGRRKAKWDYKKYLLVN